MSLQQRIIPVLQGQQKVSDAPDTVFTTLLGSCIAVCLFDEQAQIGGMNHFLLPGIDHTGEINARYGVHSMELLINALLNMGAEKDQLQAKVFGGSSIIGSHQGIGEKNQIFVKKFLEKENIPCAASHMGGTSVRKIRFKPTNGKVRHFLLPDKEVPKSIVEAKPCVHGTTNIELF